MPSICPNSSAHRLKAYLQELGSLSPSDHRSADDMLNSGSDASHGSMQLLQETSNKSGPQTEMMVLGTPCRHMM
jgi:hypothetical protein